MPRFAGELLPAASGYALLDSSNLRGGFMLVWTELDRDNIEYDKLKEGMLVYVQDNKTLYQLSERSTWEVFEVSGGAGNFNIFSESAKCIDTSVVRDSPFITIDNDAFLVGDIIGFGIDEELNGNYLVVTATTSKGVLVTGDTVPKSGDRLYLMGSTTLRIRLSVLILHKSNGVTVLSLFTNSSIDTINTEYSFRLGLTTTSTWKMYAEDVYLKGTFINNNGENLADKVESNFQNINVGLTNLRKGYNTDNLLTNPYFVNGLNCWVAKKAVKFFKIPKGFVTTNQSLLTANKTGAFVTVEDGLIVLRLIKGKIQLINDNLKQANQDLWTLPNPYYVTLSFYYKPVTDGSLSMSLNTWSTTIKTTASDEFVQYVTTFLWDGSGDFTIQYDGEIKIHSLIMKVNEIRSFELKYSELFEYSDILVKMAKEYK